MAYLLYIWSAVLVSLSATAARPSNITISIGNHYNTQVGAGDRGTNITGLTITLKKWFGKVSLEGNGNQIEVSSSGNDSTTIRMGFGQNSTKSSVSNSAVELRAPIENVNNTIPSRRKRHAGFLPILPFPPTPFVPSVPPAPAIPIPTMNSNYISIDGELARLPDSITNLAVKASSSGSSSVVDQSILPILPIPPTPFVPSVPPAPAIPIPTMNSNYISIDGELIRLSDSITNLTVNASSSGSSFVADQSDSLQQPWQFLQTLKERRPSKILDPLVNFLANNYLSTGKVMVDKGLTALNATEIFFYNIANNSLNYVTDQVSMRLQAVTRSFNGLTQMKRTCVGGVPEDSGRRVMERATGCVRERLDEAIGIVDQFRTNVEVTEGVYSGWLIEMQKCNARNFPTLADSELDAAQRECYAQALVSPTTKIVDIPLRWISLVIRTNTAVMTFREQVAFCVARVGLEVAAISAEFGSKIASCALRLI